MPENLEVEPVLHGPAVARLDHQVKSRGRCRGRRRRGLAGQAQHGCETAGGVGRRRAERAQRLAPSHADGAGDRSLRRLGVPLARPSLTRQLGLAVICKAQPQLLARSDRDDLRLQRQLHSKVTVGVELLHIGEVIELALGLDQRWELHLHQLDAVRQGLADSGCGGSSDRGQRASPPSRSHEFIQARGRHG
eukprot:scaffold24863_cov112-Isochrysis_galbana.AAC.2